MYEEDSGRLISPQKYGDIWGLDRRTVVAMCAEHFEGFPASRLGANWKIDKVLSMKWTENRLQKGLPLYVRGS